MSSEESRSQGPLESLIAEILEAENRGESVDRNAIIKEHSDLANSLRDFFANHDRMKAAAYQEDPTLRPDESGLEHTTIPPKRGNGEEATIPPRPVGEDPTMPPTRAASTDGPAVGDQVRYFGDYELLEEIARGGMGVVFKARQINLNRIVALKMILSGQFAGEEDVQRFYREAEAAAALDHPGIVPIFEIGEHQGQHYFSMGYIKGESLAQTVADGPLPPRDAAEVVKKICDAMAYAHERGVIHRDLKPANILIDANAQPKVTDFGLAKKTEADSDLTGTGQILGTPAYMPPEQASGTTDVGPLADVYALGAILYCLLTGHPPFQASSPMDTLIQVLDREPLSPRMLNPGVPQDLETICLKCLDKQPSRRYESANELSAELERYRTGVPILARPVGQTERIWRWCRRNPELATAISLAVGLLLAIAIAGPAVAVYQSRLRNLAELRTADAERRLYFNRIMLAQREWESNSTTVAMNNLTMCPTGLRDWEHDYLHTFFTYSTVMRGHSDRVIEVAFSPDGQRIASGSMDRTIRVWNKGDAEASLVIPCKHGIPVSVHFSLDSSAVIVQQSASGITRWLQFDAMSGQQSEVRRSDNSAWPLQELPVDCQQVTQDRSRSVSGFRDQVYLWDWSLDVRNRVRKLDGHTDSVSATVFSPDETQIASGSADETIRLWDARTGQQLMILRGHTGGVTCLEYSRDGTRLVSGSKDSSLKLWDPRTGEELRSFKGHDGPIQDVAFDSESKYVVSCSNDQSVRLWDVSVGEQPSNISTDAALTDIAYSPDGKRVALALEDGTVRVSDLKRKDFDLMLGGDSSFVGAVTFSPNGQLIATGGRERIVRVWDERTGLEVKAFAGHTGEITGLSFSPDDTRLASSSTDKTVRLWNLNSDASPIVLRGHDDSVDDAAFNASGTQIISSSRDRTLILWDAGNGTRLHTYRGHRDGVLCAAFLPNGSQFISGARDSTLRLWDLKRGTAIAEASGHAGPINCISINRNGTRVASASDDETIKVWDAKTLTEAITLRDHVGPVTSLSFSPDGTLLVSGSADQTLRIWDASRPLPAGMPH